MQISSSTTAAGLTSPRALTPSKPATPTPSVSTTATAPTTTAHTVPSAKAQAESAAIQSLANSTYSTSVGGKSYSGNVSQTDGLYEISIPNLPGSSVSASSLQDAENALNARIDLLA